MVSLCYVMISDFYNGFDLLVAILSIVMKSGIMSPNLSSPIHEVFLQPGGALNSQNSA